MTAKKIFGIVLVIIIAVLVIVFAIKKSANVVTPIADTPSGTTQRTMCYVWNTEAGDKATLTMTAIGSDVVGRFDFVPAEKDSKTGTITGTLNASMTAFEGWWNSSAEGMTVTEELKIKLTNATAAAGFGEMKDRGDGTYVYVNPEVLSYLPVMQLTDCNDSALL